MFERFTDQARRVVVLSQQEARELESGRIGTEHLLLGMLREDLGVATTALNAAGVTYDAAREVVAAAGGDGGGDGSHLPFSDHAKRSLELALREALVGGDQYLDAEHVLLGVLRIDACGAVGLLEGLGVDVAALRRAVADTPAGPAAGPAGRDEEPSSPRRSGAKKSKVLEQFGRELVQAARDGELDPVVGRDTEVTRVIQVLCRRTKANPVLVGPPGVGKTAVAEGLAQAIADGAVPDLLAGTKLWSVDMGAMVAGTKFRGDFEERVKGLIEEASAPDVVLFVDEIHAVLGVGAGDGGGMDAGNLLKPALSRGVLRLVGATTDDEYRIVEKDKALERRLARVEVGEPDTAVCRQILDGLRATYEDHHHLVATDDALDAAVRLTDRYLPDRRLPDKAIDAIDEAMARVRLRGEVGTPGAVEMRDTVLAAERLVRAGKVDLVDQDEVEDAMEALELAGVPWQVTEAEVAEVVSAMSGVPIAVGEDERGRLLGLEAVLHAKVVGQDDAVVAVARALRRVRAGLASRQRVGGAFLFVGPTGVGKTELARTLASEVMRDADALIQLDMSEYMESHSVSRLIGSPPGYVGHGEGGQLTEAVRRKPFSVVLFDEIEKAHPDVHNILLQLLEEGRLTDSQGRKVDFTNTVVILTSNIGTADLARPHVGFGRPSAKADSQVLHEAVRKSLRPELIGRLDEVIVFNPLTFEEVSEIARMMVAGVAGRLADHGVGLEVTDGAYRVLCEAGYDRMLGARPMRRTVQNLVEDRLALAVLDGEVRAGQLAVLDGDGDGGLRLAVLDDPGVGSAVDEVAVGR